MLGSSRRIGRLSSNQTSPLRKEINNSLYLDNKQVVSHPFTRWSITHQGVVDSLNRTGFTYEQTTDVFPVRSVVKDEENCSNNLTRYSNKPLIITVTTVSAISVAVTVPSGAHLRPHYFTKHGHQFSDIQCT